MVRVVTGALTQPTAARKLCESQAEHGVTSAAR